MTATPQTLAPRPTTATTFDIDPSHSVAEFSVRHLMISTVKGRFGKISGAITYDRTDPSASHVEGEIDVASIDTADAKRDAHLRSPEFFDVDAHPKMSFRSTRVEAEGDEGVVHGELTLRGTTRPVAIKVEKDGEAVDPWGNPRLAITATTTLDRTAFGLTWNQALETGGVLVGDKVKVTLHLSAVARTA